MIIKLTRNKEALPFLITESPNIIVKHKSKYKVNFASHIKKQNKITS